MTDNDKGHIIGCGVAVLVFLIACCLSVWFALSIHDVLPAQWSTMLRGITASLCCLLALGPIWGLLQTMLAFIIVGVSFLLDRN